jgi:hypothetical protein
MQAKQMSELLTRFALLLDGSGRNASAVELLCIADALRHGGTEPTSKRVTKVKQHWKSSKREPAFPADLKALLEQIQSILTESGARSAAKDCAAVLTLFVGRPDSSANAFGSNVASAITAPIPTSKTKKGPPDQVRISSCADALTAASTSNEWFDNVLRQIEDDGSMSKSELDAIARQFLGTNIKFKTKTEIFEAIRTRQIQDAIQSSRDRRGEKIAV